MSETQNAAGTGSIVIRIPLSLKRRGGRKEVIMPDGSPPASPAPRHYVNPVVVALARAYRWAELLESGRFGSASAIAAAQGVDPSYVARIMRLCLLAPDIVESVLDGTAPDGLSLGKLYQLPTDWDEQRSALAVGGSRQR